MSPDAVWILDGATGMTDERVLPGSSDALWLVEQIDRALAALTPTSLATGEVLRRAVTAAAHEFARAALRPGAPASERPSASLAMVRAQGASLELSNLGDCRILRVERAGVRCFGSSKVAAFDRRVVDELSRRQRDGMTRYADIWPHLVDIVRQNRARMNQEDGYWILDLTERPLEHVQYAFAGAADVDHLLLVSDGFYRLVDTYRRYSDESLVRAALDRGLAALYDELRAIERDDEESLRYPRIKVRDDATALLVRVLDAGRNG